MDRSADERGQPGDPGGDSQRNAVRNQALAWQKCSASGALREDRRRHSPRSLPPRPPGSTGPATHARPGAIVLRYAILDETAEIALRRQDEPRSATTTSSSEELLRDLDPGLADRITPRRKALAGFPTRCADRRLRVQRRGSPRRRPREGRGRTAAPGRSPERRSAARLWHRADGAQRQPDRAEQAARRRDQSLRALPEPPRAGSSARPRRLLDRLRELPDALERLVERVGAKRVFLPARSPPRPGTPGLGPTPTSRCRSTKASARRSSKRVAAERQYVAAGAASSSGNARAEQGLISSTARVPLVAEALHEVAPSSETRARSRPPRTTAGPARPESFAPMIRSALEPILDEA